MGILGDWLMVKVMKVLVYLPVYTAIVATLTLLAVVFGVPFVDGNRW